MSVGNQEDSKDFFKNVKEDYEKSKKAESGESKPEIITKAEEIVKDKSGEHGTNGLEVVEKAKKIVARGIDKTMKRIKVEKKFLT